MNYWLFKSEPFKFSFDDLKKLLQAEIDRTQALMGLPDLSDRPTA